ncbi:MAG TPA: hypothetical protein VEW48_11315 [Thermoanaerobaculia bacterium]|nr:hypothetical protein [Thermoanaerobaculia bacterium]
MQAAELAEVYSDTALLVAAALVPLSTEGGFFLGESREYSRCQLFPSPHYWKREAEDDQVATASPGSFLMYFQGSPLDQQERLVAYPVGLAGYPGYHTLDNFLDDVLIILPYIHCK